VTLSVTLERELPRAVEPDGATVAFVAGTCSDSSQRITGLSIAADQAAVPVAAPGMPWPPDGRFWAMVPLPAAARGTTIAVGLRVALADGSSATTELGAINVTAGTSQAPRAPAPAPAAVASPPDARTIAVCMATHEPDPGLLEAQIESLRAQTDRDWICLISDDCSGPERFERMRRLIGDDPRFELSRSPRRLGFYRNFERALRMCPPGAGLVALCDQDDRWDADKLAALRAGLGDAMLVYSDLRLVTADGQLLRETLWSGRSNNHTSLASMVIANTITGAAMLFRRELLELALPFPDTPGLQFHDAWLAVIALTAGRVAYVDRALYDYVQHPGAVFGDVTHGAARSSRNTPRARLRHLASSRLADRLVGWRAAYFYGYLSRAGMAEVALARCGASVAVDKRRDLERLLDAPRSRRALAWLWARPARALRGRSETLGNEWVLARGLTWLALASALAHRPAAFQRALHDAAIPPPEAYSEARLRRWRARL
jgi:glycosyltransferase involved in cell wall biosynthesis